MKAHLHKHAMVAAHAGLEYFLARVIQDFMGFMQQTGLSRPQIHALLHVYHAGSCRISDIGELSDSSPAAASQLVERLVQQGLLERTENAVDRRIKELRLTDKGLKLIHEGVATNRYLADLIEALPPQQREVVHTALGYLARASEQARTLHEER